MSYAAGAKYTARAAALTDGSPPASHLPLAVVRFCAENRVTSPEALRAFRGSAGLWRSDKPPNHRDLAICASLAVRLAKAPWFDRSSASYVAEESDDATYVFKRGAPSGGAKAGGAKASAAASGKKKRAAEGEDEAEEAPGPASSRRKKA